MLLQHQSKRRIDVNNSIVAITLCVILPVAVIAQGISYDKETLDLFAQYPKSDALDHVAHSHAYHEFLARSHLVFYSTWFLDGNPRVAMLTRINADGEAYKVRSVFDWANQAATNWQLTADQLQSLLAATKGLPQSAQSVPLEFLVVVTFQQDGKWLTRLYDRRKPPNELITIYKLAHSAMDSK
jgi:hypothetical protein